MLVACNNVKRINSAAISFRSFANKSSDVSKSIKSKFAIQKMAMQKSINKYETRQKIQNPSAYQHVKRLLRKCESADEVMHVMSANAKCEDVQVGTAAIKMIKMLCENRKVSRDTALKLVDKIWALMRQYVVGMDCAAYNEYLHFCDLLRFDKKAHAKFDEMRKQNIYPNIITVKILMRTLRVNGDVEKALKYLEIAMNYEIEPDAEMWAIFLSVCAKSQSVKSAEECWVQCPFKTDASVAYRMMNVYKYAHDLDNVLKMEDFMEEHKIEKDVKVYTTIIDSYRIAKQWEKAIETAEIAISNGKWDAITITGLFEANIGLIRQTPEQNEREIILRYIENDIVSYWGEIGERDRFRISRFAYRMLDAYVHTYSNGFGPNTFRECCKKYNVQYWEEGFNVPTVNLLHDDYKVASAIIAYVFEHELNKFQDSGLYILITANRALSDRFGNVNEADTASILSTLPTPMLAVKTDSNCLFISPSQTQKYEHGKEESLF